MSCAPPDPIVLLRELALYEASKRALDVLHLGPAPRARGAGGRELRGRLGLLECWSCFRTRPTRPRGLSGARLFFFGAASNLAQTLGHTPSRDSTLRARSPDQVDKRTNKLSRTLTETQGSTTSEDVRLLFAVWETTSSPFGDGGLAPGLTTWLQRSSRH